LTPYREWCDTRPGVMDALSPRERRLVELKAIEQAFLLAQLAKMEAEALYPVGCAWPFRLSESDRAFLKIQKISAA
jgi:hypothetical protein